MNVCTSRYENIQTRAVFIRIYDSPLVNFSQSPVCTFHHDIMPRFVFQCLECMDGFGTLMDALTHQGRQRRLRGGLASFKGGFITFSYFSHLHVVFSYHLNSFHTQKIFFHTLCRIFILIWYKSKSMV